ncbi:glycosyltransferase family 4 protein [uncultured Pontibacter sp.]|uniref:glycosyltransferase family 4 protein n=1 Tax=uncultured Pontibacter sp. TaxID=453356 RepID=UPI002608BB82|nr:glycosyltransferase family 4 protein [uncultured Pontibacter sp.]
MLKILYYSTAYTASHGGSNHSKAFVKFAKENAAVSEVNIFPSHRSPILQVKNNSSVFKNKLLSSKLLLPFRLYKRNKLNIQSLYSAIDQYKPNVLVVRMDNNFFQLKHVKLKYPNLILVTEVNGSSFDESFKNIVFKSYFQNKEKEAFSLCDLNFFVSSFLRDRVMGDMINYSRDLVNHNGFDDTLFVKVENDKSNKEALGIAKDMKVIGYLGTLDLHKKMHLFIDAYAKVSKVHKNVVALVVGGGPALEEIESYVGNKGLSDKFYFTGQVEHKDVHKYLKAFDVAVHHAANDYMSPLKIFEYLALQLPVIGPDIPAVREIFEDRKHLLLTAPTVSDIEEKISLLLNHSELAYSIAKNGNEYVKANFTWRENVERVIGAIQKIHPIEDFTVNSKATA